MQHDGDKDMMNQMPHKQQSNVEYLPSKFYSPLYYPYLNQPGYVAPVVAVRFNQLLNRTLIMVECVLKTDNQQKDVEYYDKNDKRGAVTFELIKEYSL